MTENVRKYLSISFAVLTCIALILSLKISLVYIRAEELPGVAAYFENGFSFLNRNNLTIAHYLFDNFHYLWNIHNGLLHLFHLFPLVLK